MKNFMNFVGIMLGAVMLCDKATDENYNFEAGMKKQEIQNEQKNTQHTRSQNKDRGAR